MSRVFKTRYFSRWMHKTALTDPALCAAVEEMRCGLVDADLGGGVVKKRVALPGRGKSGGSGACHQNSRAALIPGSGSLRRCKARPIAGLLTVFCALQPIPIWGERYSRRF
ncbi:type II toxin-antitoxin system RelE/ParE family toxin [Vandammella animalimorsus]|uniref:type II toxin-antitoxin system RelE/ParE family toxin n=1 Tax=Vandammella animalimorsus TaxID=2029117 RepID=UPI0031BA56B7